MQANYPDMWRRTKDKGPFAIHTSIHLSLQRTFFIYHPLKTFRWNYPELEWCTRYALSPFYPGGSCALPRTQEFKDPLLHGCFTREGKTFKTYVANKKTVRNENNDEVCYKASLIHTTSTPLKQLLSGGRLLSHPLRFRRMECSLPSFRSI